MNILFYLPRGRVCEEEDVKYLTHKKILPYSILTCATFLINEGYKNTKIVDTQAEDLILEGALKRIIEQRPDILVTTVNMLTHDMDLRGIKKIKQKTNCVVIGLINYPCFAREIMEKHEEIDVAIGKEWAEAIFDVVENLYRLNKVKGIFYRENNEIIRTGSRKHRTINNLPIPNFDLLPMKKYDFYIMRTSVGCNYNCLFCPAHERHYDPKNVDRIIEEIEIMKSYGNKRISFISNDLTQDLSRAKELFESLIGRNVFWGGAIRLSEVDEEMIDLMKKSNCLSTSFGVESGNQEVLDLNRKGLDLEDVKKKIKYINKKRILATGYFMIGMKGDTEETIKETYNFVIKNMRNNKVSFDICIPYPNTDFYRYLKYKNYIDNLTVDNVIWIYRHLYSNQISSGIKPSWRLENLTFDKLVELRHKYYPLIKRKMRFQLFKNRIYNSIQTLKYMYYNPVESLKRIL